MAEGSMFPLPKEHWLPHKGVKECMSCSSVFSKTLFGSSKENCRKCGRVICKQCCKYKIKEVRIICRECYEEHENESKAISIATKNLYSEYENRKNNPYLSADSLQQYQNQFNLHISRKVLHVITPDRTRSHSADVLSTTSTIPIPHTLLDITTDAPLPVNNNGKDVPSPHIISPLLKEEQDENNHPINIHINDRKRSSFREFRERKIIDRNDHNRKASQSVGNIGLSISRSRASISDENEAKSATTITVTETKWLHDELFDIDEKMMKLLEDKTYVESKINNSQHMVIRLDGFQFGMFSNKMKKPFDKRFHNAMVLCACDLLKEFDAYTVFTQSDEIVLIYPLTHHKIKSNYLFGGKIAKILSIVCSFASIQFIKHLTNEFGHYENNCFGFNGKCFNISNEIQLFDYIIWRLKKNVRGYHKKILTVDNEFSHGTFVKKEKYFNHVKKKERERITSVCVQIESKHAKYYEILTDKYWKYKLLNEIQNKQINKKKSVSNLNINHKKNKISFDDSEIFPDIYNTMIIHSGNTMQRAKKPIPITVIPPKPRPKPKPPKIKEKKFKIIPKRDSLPIKKDVYAIAAQFERESKKQQMEQKQAHVSKIKEVNVSKVEKKEGIEIKNEIYSENNIYKTMIVHNIDQNNKTAQIIKPIKSKQQKQFFFKPKQKAYHHNINNNNKNTTQQNITKPNVEKARKAGKPIKPVKPIKIMPPKPKAKPKIVKPASSNPNYKYNYNITLNEVKVSKKQEFKNDSPKPMSAKDRIREMNERLQKLQQ